MQTEVSKVLTAIKEPPMTVEPVNIAAWAVWLGLETFNDPQLLSMVECCARWAKRMERGEPPSWLTLLGTSGTGKTHCGQKLWRWSHRRFRWFEQKYLAQRIYWPEFIENLRDNIGYGLSRDLRNWPVLFLDDIGAERDPSGFSSEKLNTILGCRVGKWTIITSNKSLEDLGNIDVRISDRIVREPGNIYIEVNTESYGLRKK